MAFTVYARYFNALEDDYIEVYETFSDREKARIYHRKDFTLIFTAAQT